MYATLVWVLYMDVIAGDNMKVMSSEGHNKIAESILHTKYEH